MLDNETRASGRALATSGRTRNTLGGAKGRRAAHRVLRDLRPFAIGNGQRLSGRAGWSIASGMRTRRRRSCRGTRGDVTGWVGRDGSRVRNGGSRNTVRDVASRMGRVLWSRARRGGGDASSGRARRRVAGAVRRDLGRLARWDRRDSSGLVGRSIARRMRWGLGSRARGCRRNVGWRGMRRGVTGGMRRVLWHWAGRGR